MRGVPITIPGGAGPLAAVAHIPERTPAPVVVCCHGLLSSKNSEKYVVIGEEFSRAGLAVVRFDFAGCGDSAAALGENLLASRVGDLKAVLSYVDGQPWAKGPVGLLGSSLGGYISLLGAASDAADGARRRVQAVVCWAAPFDLERIGLSPEDLENLKQSFPPGFETGSPMNLRALPALPRVLLIHGRRDEIIPWKDAVDLYNQVGEPRRLLLVETADHRLLDPSCRRLAIRVSLDWLREQGLLDEG